jgi:hypothetical protein
VLIEARMRVGGAWMTICIRNISSRGLMAQSASSPAAGTYVEIRRGLHVIVGRIAWSRGRKFGLHTQDRMNVEAVIRDPLSSAAGTGTVRLPNGTTIADRRGAVRAPSIAEQHERSRRWAQSGQSWFFIAVAILCAAMVAQAVYRAVSTPFQTAARSLASGG